MSYTKLYLAAGALFASLWLEVLVWELQRHEQAESARAWRVRQEAAERALDLNRRAKARREAQEHEQANALRRTSWASYAKGQEACD